MVANDKFYGDALRNSDRKEFMMAINTYIDDHLNTQGIRYLTPLRDKIASDLGILQKNWEMQGSFEYTEFNKDMLELIVDDEVADVYFNVEDLILSKAVIANLSVFDISTIINKLNINIFNYVENFDGIDSFGFRTKSRRLIDPLTLSIGVLQGAAVNPNLLEEIKDKVWFSTLLFSAFIGSGAATNFVSDYLDKEERFSSCIDELGILVLGSLTYARDKAHLPGGSFDQYLIANMALDPVFTKHTTRSAYTWEDLYAQAKTAWEGSEYWQELVAHILSENFQKTNGAKVRCLLNNICCLADQELQEAKGSYRILIKSAEGSPASEILELMNVKINFLGIDVFDRFHSGADEVEYRALIEEIISHGSAIMEKTLCDGLKMPTEDIGMSFLILPGLAMAASGGIMQQVDYEVALTFLKVGLEHYLRIKEHPDWDAKFSNREALIKKGFSYLFCQPGVQQGLMTYYRNLTRAQQDALIDIGMHPKYLKTNFDDALSKVISRDLGI